MLEADGREAGPRAVKGRAADAVLVRREREHDGARAKVPHDDRRPASPLPNAEVPPVRAEGQTGDRLCRAKVPRLLLGRRVEDDGDAARRIRDLPAHRIRAERRIVQSAQAEDPLERRLLHGVRRHAPRAAERFRAAGAPRERTGRPSRTVPTRAPPAFEILGATQWPRSGGGVPGPCNQRGAPFPPRKTPRRPGALPRRPGRRLPRRARRGPASSTGGTASLVRPWPPHAGATLQSGARPPSGAEQHGRATYQERGP